MSDSEVKRDDASNQVKDDEKADAAPTEPEATSTELTAVETKEEEQKEDASVDAPSKTSNSKSTGRTPRGGKAAPKAEVDETTDYAVGDRIQVKIQGYPWWPAIVVTPEHFPAAALAARPHSKPRKDGTSVTTLPVQFLGAPEYYWSRPTDIKRLTKEDIQTWLDAPRKSAAKGLKAAYSHALLDPKLEDLMKAKTELEAQLARNEEDDDEEDDAEDVEMADEDEDAAAAAEDSDEIELDDEGKPVKKSKSKKSKKSASTPKTPKKTPAKTPTKKRKTEENGGEPSAKKSRATPRSNAKAAKEPSPPASPEMSPEEAQKKAREQKVKNVMFWRHKLQKCLLGKDVPDDKLLDDIPGYLDKLDTVEANVDLFRETKIGKVLLRVNKLEKIPRDDELGIKKHVGKLLEKWQEVMDLQKKKDDEDASRAEGADGGAGDGAAAADKDVKEDKDDKATAKSNGHAETSAAATTTTTNGDAAPVET